MFGGCRKKISGMVRGLLTFSGLGVPAGSLEYKDGLYHSQIRRHLDLVDFIKKKG